MGEKMLVTPVSYTHLKTVKQKTISLLESCRQILYAISIKVVALDTLI